VRDGPVLRILSYNIDSALGGLPGIIDEIDRYSPDIVALQEVRTPEEISGFLRTRYPTVNASGQFILATRYTVSSSVGPEPVELDGRLRSPRFTQQVLQTPLGTISLYNIHPISPREVFHTIRGQGLGREMLSRRLFSSTNASIFETNSRVRSLQMRAVAATAQREPNPVLIAGDTNLPHLSLVLHQYLSGYQDGFTKVGWGFGYTFPTNRHPWLRLDRILASEQLRFVRFEVGSSPSSDHRCVVADVQRRRP
ncbi:MAG: endonuclease/exonuclease/phosphatase family protein, partial [Myxococcota bacterium]|nr:endonuclease/exonuclease/phosphatase family protein [Myxococcota bacterium]